MKQYRAVVTSTAWLTPTILGIRIQRPNGQPFFSFQPGQYASINFPNYRRLNGYRPFSIASSPTKKEWLDFGIRVNGSYTSTLKQLQPNDRATVQGPFGTFTTRGTHNRSLVLLAGGIGVTPFMSIIRTATDLQLPTPITLLFSNRTIKETPYRDELLALQKQNPNFRVLFAVSNEPVDPTTPNTVAGMLTGDTVFSTAGESFWGSIFFLCGPSPFMNAMELTLTTMGIDRKNIRRESFSVKPGALFEAGSPWPKLVFAGWGATAAIALGIIYTHGKKPIQLLPVFPATNTAPLTNVQPVTPPVTNVAPVMLPTVPTNPTPVVTTPTPVTPAPTVKKPVLTPPIIISSPSASVIPTAGQS